MIGQLLTKMCKNGETHTHTPTYKVYILVLVCVCVLPACLPAHYMHALCPQRPEEPSDALELWRIPDKPPGGCPLKEQPEHLTTKPFF